MALQYPNVGPAPVRAVFAMGGSPESACPPDVLLRYEIAFDRQFSRALTRLLALQSKSAVRSPAPYFPEVPAGQTWKENCATAKLTQEAVENEDPLPGSDLPPQVPDPPDLRPAHPAPAENPANMNPSPSLRFEVSRCKTAGESLGAGTAVSRTGTPP